MDLEELSDLEELLDLMVQEAEAPGEPWLPSWHYASLVAGLGPGVDYRVALGLMAGWRGHMVGGQYELPVWAWEMGRRLHERHADRRLEWFRVNRRPESTDLDLDEASELEEVLDGVIREREGSTLAEQQRWLPELWTPVKGMKGELPGEVLKLVKRGWRGELSGKEMTSFQRMYWEMGNRLWLCHESRRIAAVNELGRC